MLCLNMNISYLDLWNDFIGSLKLYKKDEVHLNDKGGSIFATKMDEFFIWLQDFDYRNKNLSVFLFSHTETKYILQFNIHLNYTFD